MLHDNRDGKKISNTMSLLKETNQCLESKIQVIPSPIKSYAHIFVGFRKPNLTSIFIEK